MGILGREGLATKLVGLEQWCVGYARMPIAQFIADPRQAEFHWIKPSRATEILADPFGLERDGKLTIYAEQLIHGRKKGQIVALDEAGEPRPVLAKPFHLSYPFLLEEDGRRYLAPEQAETGNLAFYPIEGDEIGEAAAQIEGLGAVDPTFLFHEGLWWLFCTHRGRGPNHQLFLYFAERLFGPYRAHPANPIVTGAAQARPGGRIIRLGKTLLRPAQDCSESYGAALHLCLIELLSPTAYVERIVQRLEACDLGGGFAQGVHTLDHTEHYVILDTKRFAFSPFAGPIKIVDKLAGRSL
jgi:hypothetical protein